MTDELADYIGITRLQAAYADVVTRRAWPELAPLFVRDAPIEIDTVTRPVVSLRGAQELGEFVSAALGRFEFFEFVILNTVVDVGADGDATGRLWMVEIRQDREGEWSNAFGLYRDRYARDDDGRWRFAARDYRSVARRAGADRADVFELT